MEKQIKTEWDLSLFYKGFDDPQIEKDIQNTDKAFSAFEKKYKNNKKYLEDETLLLKALEESEKLSYLLGSKSLYYLSYLQDLNSRDDKVRAKLNLLSQRMSKIGNKTLFFNVQIAKIPKNLQKVFLKSSKLKKYKYLLEKTFESAKYVLSEPEEKILSLKSLTSHSMWIDLTEKILNTLTVKHKGKDMPLSQASDLIHKQKTQKERFELYQKYLNEIKKAADSAESELNAIVTDKKIEDELRGYKDVLDATLLQYQNDKKTILNLADVVTKNFKISHRFYKVKAKMLKLSKLNYSDRAASIPGFEIKMSFKESYDVLKEVLHKVDSEFEEILEGFVTNGQIDVFPKLGKTSGAYSSSSQNSPGMVLLNHTDSFDSLLTFAHEMGHATHSVLSYKTQPPFYKNYSMSTAEVASTLFESFVFYDQLEKMTDDQKINALHDRIGDDIQTICRQIACFNFEREMHTLIREKGNMSKVDLANLMNKHMRSYLGPVFDINNDDGYFFVYWSHIRSFFYVYSYAFGQLASKALYKKYSEDKSYIKSIKQFLSLGGSMTPEDIFKSIGVDVKKPNFWELGMKEIEKDVALLEKLVRKR